MPGQGRNRAGPGTSLAEANEEEKPTMKLTPQQLETFDREGYLFLPEVFSPEETALLRVEAARVYGLEREEVWRESSGAPRTAFAAQTYSEPRSEEHTSELQSLMRISYAVFCLKKK